MNFKLYIVSDEYEGTNNRVTNFDDIDWYELEFNNDVADIYFIYELFYYTTFDCRT